MERTLIRDLKENKQYRIDGMIYKVRDSKYMVFLMIKDRSSYIQVSVDKKDEELTKEALNITVGSIVSITGEMVKSEYVKDGGREFLPKTIKLLSKADIYPIDENSMSDMKLDYRWLDLRGDIKSYIFPIQSKMVEYMRDFLYKNDFMEIHTPKLIGTASESGSDVFEVKYFDRKAYLAQSPQFYKQMAIASGFERVFEVAPCFRAENSNTNRHCTEFTSFDLEFAYIDSYKDVMEMEEKLLTHMLKNINKEYGDLIKEKFGQEVIVPKGHFPVIELDELYKKLNEKYGYVIPEKDVGDLNAETEKLACKYAMEEYNSEFLFIIGYNKAKRPFYHMRDKERLLGYDLLYKGMEITSGAQREHRYEELLSNAKEKGLGKDVEFYLQFFKYGCPPHGGFAIGVDRLTMLLLGLDHIREAELIFRNPNRLNP